MRDDRIGDRARHARVIAVRLRDLQALLHRVLAERRDDLLPRRGERALGDVLADQVDRRHQRLGLDRQQARGPVEVVAVGLRVHFDLAELLIDLGIEDVGAASEVDDVEHVDVLAQLLLADLEPLADVRDLNRLARAAGLDEDARESDQAREALRPNRRLGASVARSLPPRSRLFAPRGRRRAVPLAFARRRGRGVGRSGRCPPRARGARPRRALAPGCRRSSPVALLEQLEPVLILARELSWPQQSGVRAQAEHPRDDRAEIRVRRAEYSVPAAPLLAVLRLADLAVAAEMALHLPGDALADQDLRHVALLAQLPVGPAGIGARVEAGRTAKVVLGLRRIGDFPAHAREAKHADRFALVRVAEQVELPAAEQQVVGIDPARAQLVALHRVVVEQDRLVAEDRRLDLGQPG